jgi:hypothetical protein
MIITLCKRLNNYIKVKQAVKQADRLAKLTRKRHYVIQVKGKMLVMNRARVNALVDKGFFAKSMKDSLQLQKFSIYFTK